MKNLTFGKLEIFNRKNLKKFFFWVDNFAASYRCWRISKYDKRITDRESATDTSRVRKRWNLKIFQKLWRNKCPIIAKGNETHAHAHMHARNFRKTTFFIFFVVVNYAWSRLFATVGMLRDFISFSTTYQIKKKLSTISVTSKKEINRFETQWKDSIIIN